MSRTLNDIIKDVVSAISPENNKKPSAYDTQAEVMRVEDDTLWVHIPGGVDETPIRKTISASVGDTIQVRVGGGTAWATGNETAPPTDDAEAHRANAKAEGAEALAKKAKEDAEGAMSAANQAAQTMAEAIIQFNSDIEDLQNQIDGNITTWFYSVDPTLSNLPAKNWTTEQEKNSHLGDLYYNTTKGYAWRWMVSGSTYSWQRISDTDVTKALADAAEAKDVADSKRRVFYATPVPPYDKGDLWVQGSNGDILRCNVAKATGGSYAASDWVKASKYTDDTVANGTKQHFWFDSEGAHVTEAEGDDFQQNPSGGNVLITSSAMKIRKALQTLAEFTTDGITFSNEDLQNMARLFVKVGEDGNTYGALSLGARDNPSVEGFQDEGHGTIRATATGIFPAESSGEDDYSWTAGLHSDRWNTMLFRRQVNMRSGHAYSTLLNLEDGRISFSTPTSSEVFSIDDSGNGAFAGHITTKSGSLEFRTDGFYITECRPSSNVSFTSTSSNTRIPCATRVFGTNEWLTLNSNGTITVNGNCYVKIWGFMYVTSLSSGDAVYIIARRNGIAAENQYFRASATADSFVLMPFGLGVSKGDVIDFAGRNSSAVRGVVQASSFTKFSVEVVTPR